NNLGTTFNEQGKLDEAVACYRKALALNPDFAGSHYNLGITLKAQNKLDKALTCFKKTIVLQPNLAEAHNNLGITLHDLGKFEDAVVYFQNAIALKPDYAEAYCNLGNLLCAMGKMTEAVVCYRTSIKIKPGKAHSNLIFALDLMSEADTPTLQGERRKWGEIHADPLTVEQRPHTNIPDPERRLRIGYVSADFRQHSAATAFGAMLVKFDQARFDVIAYSNTANEDQYTQMFRQSATHWRNIVGLTDEAVAELIRQDGIDILVDLSGHSAGNRLLAFARKPAPIQVTAWGYPSGTGMQAMDALFADAVVIPPGERQLYLEDVRYLPNLIGYFNPEIFPAVAALPALSAKIVTFGSFNRLAKVSLETFDLWTRLLAALPDSRLLFKSSEFDSPAARDRVSRHFTEAGIAPERIVILGKTTWHEHMRAYNRIDIALDPFPHSGGTTTLEGIMMGIPTLTLRRPCFGGRASASILTTLGMTDWVAETPEQYIAIAVEKTRDLEALATFRQQLRSRFTSSVIGDAHAYVEAAESEYRLLWREWCERQQSQR
ncbi:MAG: tetratricopeptide repeat protein, partial [Sulfuricella sp.]